MPLKPIFSVELDDSQFKKFKALFDKYQASLLKLPKGWEAIAAATSGAAASQNELTGSLEEQVRLIMKKIQLEGQEKNNLDYASSKWSSIARTVTSIDRSLEQGAIRLAKWGALATGVLGGLSAVGIGTSLFGIDRLAGKITEGRRQSMGLGTTYGQLQAYNTNYSRLINAGSLLENAATAKYDITSPQYTAFMTSGVNPRTLKYGSTADITAEFLHKLEKLFKNIRPEFRGAYAKAYGIDQLMPMSDLNAFLNADPRERARIANKTFEDAKAMEVNKDAQRKWTDFTTQLDRAAKTMEASIMNKLTPIEPGLEKLSNSLVGLVGSFANSGIAKNIINDLSLGINWLAEEFNDKTFRDDLENWFTWIGTSAKSLLGWVESFSLIAPANAAEAPNPKANTDYQPGDYFTSSGNLVHGGESKNLADYIKNNPYKDFMSSGGTGGLTNLINKVSKEANIDPRIMEGIRAGESGHGRNYDVNLSGGDESYGPFQLNRKHPGDLGSIFQRETGLDLADPRTIPAQAKWVANYIKRTGNLTPWAGFHGLRDADPRWGDSGYNPETKIPENTNPNLGNFHLLHKNPLVSIRNSTGNNPVLATALTSQQSTAVDK